MFPNLTEKGAKLKAQLLPISALLLVLMIASCSDEGDDNPIGSNNGGGTIPDTVSYASTIEPIILGICASGLCHGSATGQGGLAFGNPNPSHATITSVMGSTGRFVTPGSSATSNFFLKIGPSVPNPPGGARMPQGSDSLTTVLQDAVRDWIDQGALDN